MLLSTTIPGGTVSGTWMLAESPYVVQGNITVTGTLTIEPGVEVRFASSRGLKVPENATLAAIGTVEQPITFTSDAASPSPGNWDWILFDDSGNDDTLEHCVIEYARYGIYCYAEGTGREPNIFLNEHVRPTVQNCTIRYCSSDGVYVYGCGDPDVGGYPRPVVGYASIELRNCEIYGNGSYGVELRSEDGASITHGGLHYSSTGEVGGDIQSNIIRDNAVAGVYCEGSGGFDGLHIVNNTIVGNDSYGVWLSSAGLYHTQVTNNIVAGSLLGISGTTDSLSATVAYNDLWGNRFDWAEFPTSFDRVANHNIAADPLFRNPNDDDYHLRASSPCNDAGSCSYAPATDLEGNTRYDDPRSPNLGYGPPWVDIGALEFTGEPDIELTDSEGVADDHAVDFGAVSFLGGSQVHTVTISNAGDKLLAITGVTLSDQVNYSVSWDGDGTQPATIAEGASRVAMVLFAPQALGAYNATLTVQSDDPDLAEQAIIVTLDGFGDIPDVEVTDSHADPNDYSIHFGSLHVLGGTQPQTVTIANAGPVPLSITGGDLSDTVNFSVAWDGDGTPPASIDAGGSRVATVTFDPHAAGPHSATFTIASDDPDEATVVVTLNGQGLLQDITVADSEGSAADHAIDFGTTATGEATAHTVEITNAGNWDLAITGASLSDDAGFSLEWDGNGQQPMAIVPGASRAATVTFSPLGMGRANATLTITSDDPDEQVIVVALTGYVPAPDILVADDSGDPADRAVDFGSVPVTDGTQAVAVTAANAGDVALAVAAMSLSDEVNFALAWDKGLPAAIGPGDSETATVTFDPTTAGPHSATLTIQSDDPDEPSVVLTLTGYGAPPDIAISDSEGDPADLSANFGSVAVTGGTQAIAVTVANAGDSVLTVADIALSDEVDFALAWDAGLPATIGPGGSETATVTFDPATAGAHSATLTIQSDDPDEPSVAVDLGGFATAPDIEVTDAQGDIGDHSIDFGSVPAAGGWRSYSVGIANTGDADLAIGSVALSDEVNYSVTWGAGGAAPTLMPPGSSCVATVKFMPAGLGKHPATLVIQSNDPDDAEQEVTVEVFGIGAPVPLAEWRSDSGGVVVYAYDVDGGGDVAPSDIQVRFGKRDSVAAIVLRGTEAMNGLGIAVFGASSVGTVKDARRGALGDLAFLAWDAPTKTIRLKSGIAGYDLNGVTLDGFAFEPDIDGDGVTDDRTALWSPTDVRAVTLGGDVAGDIVVGAHLRSLVCRAALAGDVMIGGVLNRLDAVSVAGGTLRAERFGSLKVREELSGTLSARGGDRKGLSVATILAAQIEDLWVDVPYGIKTIKAAQWEGGGLSAGWVRSLTTTGNRKAGVPGHFSAVLALTALAAPRATLAKAGITGDLLSASWEIAGDTGTIVVKGWMRGAVVRCTHDVKGVKLGGMENSTLYSGVAPAVADMVDSATDFVADCRLGALTIKPARGTIGPWLVDSRIAAPSIGKVTLPEVKTDNAGEPFGVAALSLGSLRWRQDGIRYAWPERRPGQWPDPSVTLDFIAVQVV